MRPAKPAAVPNVRRALVQLSNSRTLQHRHAQHIMQVLQVQQVLMSSNNMNLYLKGSYHSTGLVQCKQKRLKCRRSRVSHLCGPNHSLKSLSSSSWA